MTASAPNRRAIPDDMVLSQWRAPDGWTLRRFDRPAAGAAARGSLLFQGGRGDFFEKYLEAFDAWHRNGWHITGFDWRGQGGSGRFLADARIGHAPSLDPLLDDFAGVVASWIAETPPPHVLIGHSMGGHLVLRLLAERQPAVDAAVLIAPMLAFARAPVPAWLTGLLARGARWMGLGERPAWTDGDRPDLFAERRRTNLTGCKERYADELWWREARPEVAMGPPSWGWLAAAVESMARLGRPGALEGIAVPVLMLGTTRDRLVSAAAIRLATARLPDVQLEMFDDGAHELLREADPVRLRTLAAIERFLDARAPA